MELTVHHLRSVAELVCRPDAGKRAVALVEVHVDCLEDRLARVGPLREVGEDIGARRRRTAVWTVLVN